ncbi:MAG: hypothetical protein F4Z73_04680 [Synechococcus sp. SB0668_bin_13]|nr:hypothetical protein [Synechococcus sp. SB0668_bin_13]
MAADCGPTPPSQAGAVPWVRSWMPPALHHQFGLLSSPEAHQNTAPESGGDEQPLAATGEGNDPAFCPL